MYGLTSSADDGNRIASTANGSNLDHPGELLLPSWKVTFGRRLRFRLRTRLLYTASFGRRSKALRKSAGSCDFLSLRFAVPARPPCLPEGITLY